MTDDETDQEWKAKWLERAQAWFPIGSRVEIADSDIDEYIGCVGVVVGYCIGDQWESPIVSVAIDRPTAGLVAAGGGARDGFYEDELRPLVDEAVA
jgi:hypothetical protein